jgi:hypothetical protein
MLNALNPCGKLQGFFCPKSYQNILRKQHKPKSFGRWFDSSRVHIFCLRDIPMQPDIKVEIIEIGHQMNRVGLPKEFIAAAVSTAFEFEGVSDLLKMWAIESDPKERSEIISDIQDLIDDCAKHP